MLKKIDRARQWLEEQAVRFRCPICRQSLAVKGNGLICHNHHQFDLSKKGTLYFLNHGVQTEYNQKMFTARGQMIQAGMYEPLINKIAEKAHQAAVVLDVGCGEGGFLTQLTNKGLSGTKIGFDLSKEGIYLASNQSIEAFWCVADLTNLPFADHSIDLLLNIFSPSHYQEFQRVLTSDGLVIKVIPESGYLQELRQAFYPNDQTKQTYTNEKVFQRFAEELELFTDERITYSFEVPVDQRLNLLEMSPLEWQVADDIKQAVQKNPPTSVTIDIRMLIGKKRSLFL